MRLGKRRITSCAWISLIVGRDFLKEHIIWQVMDEETVSIWGGQLDPWFGKSKDWSPWYAGVSDARKP